MQETLKRGMGFTPPKSTTSNNGNNFLLSIGIGDYLHLPHLSHAVKDAQDLTKILSEKYQFQASHIQSIFNQDATKENIIHSFKSLVEKTKPADNVIIYFSGQGEYDEIFDEGYWMPVDAQLGNESNFIPNSYIKKMLEAINCHHLFVIVDSCFSDALFNRGTGRVANRLERDPSRWGLTSGKNKILEGAAQNENSPFAESILYLLKNNSKSIGVAELCSKVIEATASNSPTVPVGEPLNVSGHRGGQLMFHPKVDEAADWTLALSNNTITGFKSFLLVHPSGINAARAKGMIFDMETKSEWAKVSVMLENNWREVEAKIEAISDFVQKFENAPQLAEALKTGEFLEYKKDFLAAKNSVFKLRLFAQQETPFQEEAKILIENFVEETNVEPIIPSTFSTSFNIPKPTQQLPTQNTSPTSSQPEYINYSPPSKKNNVRNILIIAVALAIIFSVGGILIYQNFFKKNISELPMNLIADPSTGTMVIRLEEGTPPYGITIFRNDFLKTKFNNEEGGNIDISEHFDEEGEYELKVEDAEKRYVTQKYIIDHEWNPRKKITPPSLQAKTNGKEITITIEEGNPPYELRLIREDKSILEKTINEAGVHTIDISEIGEVAGNYLVTIEDAENQTENREIIIVKKSSPPTIQFAKKTHDFGNISQGKKVTHVFEFTNIGSEPLKIQKVKPSSKSITFKLSQKTIESGEKGKIAITFNSRKRLGKQKKTIRMVSNTNPKRTILTIKGNVTKSEIAQVREEREPTISNPRVISPPIINSKGGFAKMVFGQKTIDIGNVKQNSKINKTITFYNTSTTDLKIENISTSCRCLIVTSNLKNIPSNGKGEINISLDLRGEKGNQDFKIYISGNTNPLKTILNIKGKVLPPPKPPSYPHITDDRDGSFYRIGKLKDGKYWITENMNYEVPGSWCYDNTSVNCDKYGRLYSFNTAKKACPTGWHIPSIQEWDNLFKAYGGYPLIDKKSDGTDAYKALVRGGKSGFRVDLGGIRDISKNKFFRRKEMAYFWSADKINGLKRTYVFYKKSVQVQDTASDSAMSCRCIKD